jgi:hypothetical protein
MKIYKEIYDLDDFEFWGPAEDTMRDLSDDDKKEVFEAIEETYPDGLTETELNDILAYDDDWIRDIVGYDYSNYESKEDMEEEQTEYIVDVLKKVFPDYDEEDMESFANSIVEDGDYDSYDNEGLCRNFIDECGEDHANDVLYDYTDGQWETQREDFIENNWDYYLSDEENFAKFDEYLNEDEEYQQAMKESDEELQEDIKRDEN